MGRTDRRAERGPWLPRAARRLWTLLVVAPVVAFACTSASAPVTTQGLCLQIHEAYSGCGAPWPTCPVAQTSTCPGLLAAYSGSYVSAISACLNGGPPGDCTGSCLHPALGNLSPSAAQTKLKEDFCAACPDGASVSVPKSCSDFFSEDGELLVIFNDAVADSIDKSCLSRPDASPAADCSVTFATCANAITSQASAASALGCSAASDAGPASGG